MVFQVGGLQRGGGRDGGLSEREGALRSDLKMDSIVALE